MLGDMMSQALSRVGLTPARVERWLGVPCGCKERQQKLNMLDTWSRRVLAGKVSRAVEFLDGLMGQQAGDYSR